MTRRALLLVLLVALPLVPVEGAAGPAQRALEHLASRQMENGQFSGVSPAYVAEAAAAAGMDPAAWPTPERSALDAFYRLAGSTREDVAYKHDLRLAHALGVSGRDPATWSGGDLVSAARAGFDGTQFGLASDVNDDAFAILALRAAGVPATDAQVQAAADVLLAARGADGGWSFTRASPASSTDVTGFVLAALAAAGRDVAADERAELFLRSTRDPLEGGHKDVVSAQEPNCQSTVWALHARRLLGLPRDAEAEAYLHSLQRADGGFARSASETEPNAMCTAEAIVWLAGGRYPLPGFLPLPTVTLHAMEPAALPVPAGASHARWRIDGVGEAEGAAPVVTFPRAGTYAYALDAWGPGGRHRGEGELVVRTARPVVALPPAMDALRHVPLVIGLDAGADPDGRVAAVQVDWGDGNVTPPTDAAEHAYALPQNVTVRVRAQDDAGAWSGWASTRVHVRNRAPVLDGLPARVETDRLTTVTLDPRATDPDGDAVTLHDAAPRAFPTLGEHAWVVEARDAFGASTTARVLVHVKNLPPRLENVTVPRAVAAGEDVRLRVDARDPDGDAPAVVWRVGNRTLDGADATLRLPPGAHEGAVEATDADGGVARASFLVAVAAPEDAAAPRVPWIDALDVRLEDARLVVRVDAAPDATLRLSWTSDSGDGEAALDAPGEHAFPLHGATRVEVRLVAALDGREVARDATATRDAPAGPLPPPVLDAPPQRVRVGMPLRLLLVPLAEATGYAFDYGDGNASGWSGEPVGEHRYARAGAFEVVAHARAADGRTSSASTVVHVEPAPAAAPAQPAPDAAPLERASAPAEAPRVVTPQEAEPPRREAPLPFAAPLLLLAALARRGRRG